MDERRHENRIQTDLRILAATPDLDPTSRITNLSPTGAFIATDEPYSVDTFLAFDIKLPGDDKKMTVNARVVWTKAVATATSAGMGVEFTEMLESDQKKLANFVERDM